MLKIGVPNLHGEKKVIQWSPPRQQFVGWVPKGGNWGTLRIPFGKIGEPNRED